MRTKRARMNAACFQYRGSTPAKMTPHPGSWAEPSTTEDGNLALREPEDVEDLIGADGDALVPIDIEGYGIGADAAAGLEVPQRFSGAGVKRVEVAFV